MLRSRDWTEIAHTFRGNEWHPSAHISPIGQFNTQISDWWSRGKTPGDLSPRLAVRNYDVGRLDVPGAEGGHAAAVVEIRFHGAHAANDSATCSNGDVNWNSLTVSRYESRARVIVTICAATFRGYER